MKRPLIILSLLIMTTAWTVHHSNPAVDDKWKNLATIQENGFLGERVNLWRNQRLWFVYKSPFLLKGFENPPGEHLWQGEHAGKWLHAAVLDYETTKDPKVLAAMQDVVERLLKTQNAKGYIGTYSEDKRFYNLPADKTGWDLWTERYVLYGLLAYNKHHPDQRIVTACKKLGDLLIDTYGDEMNDITRYGTRKGLSSTTILESVVMLYETTKEKKYLDFAEQIVAWSDGNPGLRLMDAMLKNESVVNPGDGKAYQLMSNLLGYYRLYKATGEQKYLTTVTNGWKQIQEAHVLTTGGPWTRKMDYNANKECFAKMDAFNPEEIVVENCCTTTWIQLNLHLFDLSGEAKYFDEAEKSIFNHFAEGQDTDGIDWCYYTKPNEIKPPYVDEMHCCASSGPRALEMFARRLASYSGANVSINTFSPGKIELNAQQGGGQLEVQSSFPENSTVQIIPSPAQPASFAIEFRLPVATTLKDVMVNGKKQPVEKNERGFYAINRKWTKGDKITVTMDYKLQAHVQEGENGKKWVAFNYGPIALAEKMSVKNTNQPFKGINDEAGMLTKLSKSKGNTTAFEIKSTGIVLIPYASTGSENSGPRTYFEIN